MAPRRTIRARAAAATSSTPTNKRSTSDSTTKDVTSRSGGRIKKKEKRTAKHNTLMNKVRDSGVTKTKSRRRPAKKLPAAEGLDDLRNALPEFADDEEWEGCSDSDNTGDGGAMRTKRRREGRMAMRSLKSKPGAMKRKHAMHQIEVERFGRNLAALTGNVRKSGKVEVDDGKGAPVEGHGQRQRWNALRAFIGSTMEHDRAFKPG